MNKICFPFYFSKGWYDSLREALQSVLNEEKGDNEIWDYYLFKPIVWNVCYRDYLRENGVEALLKRLHEELHDLPIKEEVWQSLHKKLSERQLADFDIQCYHIDDTMTILGHEFHGLKDIQEHVSRSSSEYFATNGGFVQDNPTHPDVFVGEIWQSYPKFDSSDSAWDDRRYQNYIFRTKVVSQSDISSVSRVRHDYDYCMVHEDIPPTLLPILYFDGDGKYMILATAKESSSYGSDIKELMKVAEQGDVEAQFCVGLLYYKGNGVEKNPREAVKWFLKAAEHEHAKAQYYLAICYSTCEGLECESSVVLEWIMKSAKNGDPDALDVVMQIQQRAAEHGTAIAQYNMGLCCAKGLRVERDYKEAVRWWTKAAKQGYAKAQYFLALCYSAGEGVERDAKVALKWLLKAAKNGDPEAKEVIPDVEKQVSGESIIGNKMKVMLLKSLLLTDINR